MQEEKEFKNGSKAFLLLAAVVREASRREGENGEEMALIQHEALDECYKMAEGYDDAFLAIMIQRALILSDVMDSIIREKVAEKIILERTKGDTCDGNYS